MASKAVPGFLPSVQGFRFMNYWPSNPARIISLGPLHIPIGDTGRGLCGGMAFAARDRWERHEPGSPLETPPPPADPLFKEIVDRQFASFGPRFSVPLRFWMSSGGSQPGRDRETATKAWPAIKAEIDAGSPSMLGLVRRSGWNPLALGLGHQVVAYRYDETPIRVSIWIYDPNYPGNDNAVVWFERGADGTLTFDQSPKEPLIGLLALPFERAP
jgi:hypothetical protein